ncbi:hypothetical protein J3U87_03540 [Sulfidibacter corallicola]|uniref:PA14 domain-containing protein n=2 Tax=Sulfidibacter corallicola TaxID=2818388 RepID=A0A8A4TNF6_SULCO|nr:hypothetical protein J3U87_03540 [Sulfidibacter corallicola]
MLVMAPFLLGNERLDRAWRAPLEVDESQHVQGARSEHIFLVAGAWTRSYTFHEAGRYRFQVIGNKAVRLSIDGAPVLETATGTGTDTFHAEVDLEAGIHEIQLARLDETAFAVLELSWRKSEQGTGCSTSLGKFCAEFFNNTTLDGEPALTGETTAIHHNWSYGGPGRGIDNDRFSARWRGRFQLEGGRYLFRATADDGIRVFVDDTPVIDAWRDQNATNYSRQVDLAGGVHDIRVEYYESGFEATCHVDWFPVNRENARSAVGVNIHDLNYWSTEWTLLDVFKSSGGWFTQTADLFDTSEQDVLDLDENGWVRSLPAANDATRTYRSVAALMLNGAAGTYAPGRYVVLYEGEGTLEYSFDATFNPQLSRDGRHVLDVAQATNAGILLRITATNPSNYIRNIRVIRPGSVCGGDPFAHCTGDGTCGRTGCLPFEEVYVFQRFHPRYLNDLRKYRVIRFMDFFRTNFNETVNWGDRPRMSEARWNRWEQGAPPELAVELANVLNADAWVNLPVLADDEYVTEMARVFQENLNDDLKVYLEYGNEVWNTAFLPGGWVEREALARFAGVDAPDFVKRINYQGMRAAQVSDIWRNILGSDRLIAVMGGFHDNQTVTETALDCPLYAAENGGKPCWQSMDALAIAPYFAGYLGQEQFQAKVAAWTQQPDGGLGSLFAEITDGGPLFDPSQDEFSRAPEQGSMADALSKIDPMRSIAQARGLQLVGYEAGQHMVGLGSVFEDEAINQLFWDANRDPRMGPLYTQYLQGWRERGGGLICMFLSVQEYDFFGSWGLKEHQDQESAPKFDATMQFIDDTPCWWENCTKR